jgi:cell division GTPase FtsZ
MRQDMPINLKAPQLKELKSRIVVCGVGGAGGNAINNMIVSGLSGVDFVVANTDAQALGSSRAQRIIPVGLQLTEGLGAGSRPKIGKAATEEALEEIRDCLAGSNMGFSRRRHGRRHGRRRCSRDRRSRARSIGQRRIAMKCSQSPPASAGGLPERS